MKKSFRLFAVLATALIGGASLAMFTGCTTDYPEITITYEFNGTTYEVEYTLSRKGAPQTVQHFIELADAGYYRDTVIHDYDSDFLYGGGYVMADGALSEKDYWTELRAYEAAHDFKFTQTVFAHGADMAGYFSELANKDTSYTVQGKTYGVSDEEIPLYTVYGEFVGNGVLANTKTYTHSERGILAMYYTDTGTDPTTVSTVRADDDALQQGSSYKTNCATSLFYTWIGTSGGSELDKKYAAFGKVKDFSQIQELLDAISDYSEDLAGEEGEDGFTTEEIISNVNAYDPIDRVRTGGVSAVYHVPTEPIYIREVKVNKY